MAPKSYNVSREIYINKPKTEVFEYLKLLKNQDHWSPWKGRDPDMKQEFVGEDGSVGFIAKWESDHKQVGAGEQEIKKITQDQGIETEIRFLKPWKSLSDAYLKVEDSSDGGTKVIWVFSGTNKAPINIFMLFYNMDKAVGKDFEEGLLNLKSILES